jgi:hypothetical protein
MAKRESRPILDLDRLKQKFYAPVNKNWAYRKQISNSERI